MFIYGTDIPLEDVVSEGTAEAAVRKPVEPSEFVFTYGLDIFPETASDTTT